MARIRGIPSRADYGDPSQLEPGQLIDYFLQHHVADKAGPHYDVRFGTPDTGLFSWAVPKGVPPPGGRSLAIHQPLHAHSYGGWSGTIPAGYGKGTVESADKGKLVVNKINDRGIYFTLAHKRYPERFVLVKPVTPTKNWLLVNITPTEKVPLEKLHYKSIPASQVEGALQKLTDQSVQAKIDGASTLIQIMKDGAELASYRTSKVTGGPIVHTERFFGHRPYKPMPRDEVGTILRGEMYGEHEGKAIPTQDLNVLLNSAVANSLREQKERDVRLKTLLFDIERRGGKDVDKSQVPYTDRLDAVRKARLALPNPEQFTLPEEVFGPEAATELWRRIAAGKHPLTSEGLVIHPQLGNPVKAKAVEDLDAYVTGIFPGAGKARDAGGFTYGYEPGGPTFGRVGTGFSQKLRRDIGAAPESYIGRALRLRAQSQFPSGALRAPVLLSVHEG